MLYYLVSGSNSSRDEASPCENLGLIDVATIVEDIEEGKEKKKQISHMIWTKHDRYEVGGMHLKTP